MIREIFHLALFVGHMTIVVMAYVMLILFLLGILCDPIPIWGGVFLQEGNLWKGILIIVPFLLSLICSLSWMVKGFMNPYR